MKTVLERLGYTPIVLAVVVGAAGYWVPGGYFQDLIIGLCTTLLGLGLGVLLVNKVLNASDKRIAAVPLLELIHPNVSKLHNELFIEIGRNRFGKDKFESLIDIYQRHERSAQAFTPEDRDALFDHVMEKREELLEQFELLSDQFRELSTIVGWSFDPRIIAAALDARLRFLEFKSVPNDRAAMPADKQKAIQAYLDGEAAASKVLELFTEHLGLTRDQWVGG